MLAGDKNMVTKKNIRSVITALSVCLIFTAFSAEANEFRVGGDGSIRVDGVEYSSMKEYVESDYFRENGKRCGTRKLQGIGGSQGEKSLAHCTQSLTSIQAEYWPSRVYQIPVWWHVIHRSDGVGNVSDSAIESQMAALNEDYRAKAGTKGANGYDVRIQFILAGIDRTVNDEWFTDSGADEYSYKTSLAKDPNTFLNIYTNDASGYLGYAYFPQGSAGYWWDGIVLLWESVGGRDNGFSVYDQGRTLVHEMGHYLGLYHTFQGGCANRYYSGDLIVDTNAEAAPNYDGSVPVSSCGSPDPIHNYMDYVMDSYMWEFTREQSNRAVCSLVNYRPNLYTEVLAAPPFISPLILKN